MLLAVAILLAVAWTAPTQAATTKAIWGPSDAGAFNRYQELGVGVYQVQLSWRALAPAKPASPTAKSSYTWPSNIAQAITNASARGMKVALLVKETPDWAGPAKHAAPTDVNDYADFLRAARKQYPGIDRWMIWGETNRAAVWSSGPITYSQLLDASYGALTEVSIDDPSPNTVVGGMTFTYGETPPAAWIAAMRTSPGGPRPRMDEYGHNPFSRRCPDLAQGPNYLQNGARDISDVDTLKGDVAAAFGSKPLWLSEYTVSSDRANRAFDFYVSRATQADWLSRALRIAGAAGGVTGLGWFNLQDENAANGLTTGLLDTAGNPKPAFYTYQGTTTNEGLPGACPVETPPPPPPPPDRVAPQVSLTGKPKIRLRILLQKGYAFKFRSNEGSRASARLLIDKKTARKTGLKRRAQSAVLIGKASKGLAPAGRRSMRVKLTRKAKRKLRRARRGMLTLRLTVTDAAGNATKKRKTIRLTR